MGIELDVFVGRAKARPYICLGAGGRLIESPLHLIVP